MLQTDKPCHPLQVFFEDLVVGEFYYMIYGNYVGPEKRFEIVLSRKIQLTKIEPPIFCYALVDFGALLYTVYLVDFGLKPTSEGKWNHYNYLMSENDPYVYLKGLQ